MNIVYLIGNGFDLNLGMKTSYLAFLNYYKNLPKENDSDVIKFFKNQLSENINKWSDFEFELGKYTGNLNAGEAVMLHNHLIQGLEKYIALEEAKYLFEKDRSKAFCDYLMFPFRGRLLFNEELAMDKYYNDPAWANHRWYLKIITFNYTKSIEKLASVNSANDAPSIGNHSAFHDVILSAIEHIHGFAEKRLILGVNDISQIANEKLRMEASVVDRYVKPECNNTYGLGHDEKCQQWIREANLICLFGLSYGDTDKKWWEIVGEALLKKCKIILFEHNPSKRFGGNQGPDAKEAKELVKEGFLKKTKIEKSLWGDVKNNMYVAYNTTMFSMDIPKRNDAA